MDPYRATDDQIIITEILPSTSSDVDKEVTEKLKLANTFATGEQPGIKITEVLRPGSPREWSSNFKYAKTGEINRLPKQISFEILMKKYTSETANMLGGRFVLAIKNRKTNDELCKACLVVQGHTYVKNNIRVNEFPNIYQQTINFLIAWASIFGYV